MNKFASALLTVPTLVLAHPGHGIDLPVHAHATDAWGWVALAAIAAFALAWGLRR